MTDINTVSFKWPLLIPDYFSSSWLFCGRKDDTWLKTTCLCVFTIEWEVFSVVFKQVGFPECGKMLMLCVSAGKSVGEIACRRCEGMGTTGHGGG